jgi:pilus assembly protein Flp/PilA
MLSHFIAWIQKFDRENEGQGLVEYALIIVLVSIAAIAALTALSGSVQSVFNSIAGTLNG